MRVKNNRPTVSMTGDGGWKIDNDGNVTELTVAEANALYQTMRREGMKVTVRVVLKEEYGEEVARSLPEATVDLLTEQYESRYFDPDDIADNAAAFVAGRGSLIIEALGKTPAKVISIIAAGGTTYFIRQYGIGDFSLDEKTGKTLVHGDFDAVMGQVEQLFKGLSDSDEPEDHEEPVDVLVGRIFVGWVSYLLVKTGKEFSFAKEGGSFSLRNTFEEVVAKISEKVATAADFESEESKKAKFLANIRAIWDEYSRRLEKQSSWCGKNYFAEEFSDLVGRLNKFVEGMGDYEKRLFGSRLATLKKSVVLALPYESLIYTALDTDWGQVTARDTVVSAIDSKFMSELGYAMELLNRAYAELTGNRLENK